MTALLLSERDVLALVPFSRATLRRLEAAGRFPARRRLSPGRIAWIADEVMSWIQGTPKARPDEVN
jgi:prophage regulatory protein